MAVIKKAQLGSSISKQKSSDNNYQKKIVDRTISTGTTHKETERRTLKGLLSGAPSVKKSNITPPMKCGGKIKSKKK